MSKEFQWDDSMVQEFCNWFCRIPAHEVYKKDRIAEFKASKQPARNWEIVEMKNNDGDPHELIKEGYNSCKNNGCTIHSVRRIW